MVNNPIGIFDLGRNIPRREFGDDKVLNQMMYNAVKSSEAGRLYREAKESGNLEEAGRLENLLRDSVLYSKSHNNAYLIANGVGDKINKAGGLTELLGVAGIVSGAMIPEIAIPLLGLGYGVRLLGGKIGPAAIRLMHDKNLAGMVQDAGYAAVNQYSPIYGSLADVFTGYNTHRAIVNTGINAGRRADALLKGEAKNYLHLSGTKPGVWEPVLGHPLNPIKA